MISTLTWGLEKSEHLIVNYLCNYFITDKDVLIKKAREREKKNAFILLKFKDYDIYYQRPFFLL